MDKVVRPFRGVSADDRRDIRRNQLLEACLEVVGTAGMAATTIDAISRRAGLTKRYFYESFRTRDDAFAALAERLIADITDSIVDAMSAEASDLMDRTREGFGRVITLLTDDPRNARLFTDVIGSEVLKDTVGGAEHRIAQLLTELLLAGREVTARQRDRLQLAALVIVSGSAQAVTNWLDGTLTVSREDLIDELAQMSVAAARTVHGDL